MAEPLPRDIRADLIGYTNELTKHASDVKTAVKTSMLDKGHERVSGDCFSALIVTTTPAGPIDPAQWYALFCDEKITEDEFLGALTVGKSEAGKLLSPRDLAAMCLASPGPTHTLRVERIKGVDAELLAAVRARILGAPLNT